MAELEGPEFDPGVQSSMVLTEYRKPMMRVTTRWDYLSRYLVLWKEHVRFRLYAIILGALGAYLMFSQPITGIPCLAAAVYYYQLHKFREHRTLHSTRTIMIGH